MLLHSAQSIVEVSQCIFLIDLPIAAQQLTIKKHQLIFPARSTRCRSVSQKKSQKAAIMFADFWGLFVVVKWLIQAMWRHRLTFNIMFQLLSFAFAMEQFRRFFAAALTDRQDEAVRRLASIACNTDSFSGIDRGTNTQRVKLVDSSTSPEPFACTAEVFDVSTDTEEDDFYPEYFEAIIESDTRPWWLERVMENHVGRDLDLGKAIEISNRRSKSVSKNTVFEDPKIWNLWETTQGRRIVSSKRVATFQCRRKTKEEEEADFIGFSVGLKFAILDETGHLKYLESLDSQRKDSDIQMAINPRRTQILLFNSN